MNRGENIWPTYEIVFVNDLSDDSALELIDTLAKRAREQGITTQEYVRRWICGDSLDQHRPVSP